MYSEDYINVNWLFIKPDVLRGDLSGWQKDLCKTAVDWNSWKTGLLLSILNLKWTALCTSDSECGVSYLPAFIWKWPLMKVIIAVTFCCDNLRKSKFMALEKPVKLREFFSPTL